MQGEEIHMEKQNQETIIPLKNKSFNAVSELNTMFNQRDGVQCIPNYQKSLQCHPLEYKITWLKDHRKEWLLDFKQGFV